MCYSWRVVQSLSRYVTCHSNFAVDQWCSWSYPWWPAVRLHNPQAGTVRWGKHPAAHSVGKCRRRCRACRPRWRRIGRRRVMRGWLSQAGSGCCSWGLGLVFFRAWGERRACFFFWRRPVAVWRPVSCVATPCVGRPWGRWRWFCWFCPSGATKVSNIQMCRPSRWDCVICCCRGSRPTVASVLLSYPSFMLCVWWQHLSRFTHVRQAEMQADPPTVHPARTAPEHFAQPLASCGKNETLYWALSAWWGPPGVGALQVNRDTSGDATSVGVNTPWTPPR